MKIASKNIKTFLQCQFYDEDTNQYFYMYPVLLNTVFVAHNVTMLCDRNNYPLKDILRPIIIVKELHEQI